MNVLGNYEPKEVFQYFEEICGIPHGSKNTKPIADYLTSFANKHHLEYIRDELDNVIIIKEATKGYEDAKPVMIQGHTDMVCEKTPESTHDFMTDGLKLQVDGDFIRAKDTTLGGDDGIAVAYGLAILASKTIEHPRLEVIFTSNEEIGLLGAAGIDLSMLKGKQLINIDSEEEGFILTSCAGGCRFITKIPVSFEEIEGQVFELSIDGLLGGHSGTEIQRQLGNANILMGRCLYHLAQELPFALVSIAGGSKDNAIPRLSKARIVIEPRDREKLLYLVKEYEATLKHEYRKNDPDVAVHALDLGEEVVHACHGISKEKIIFYLMNVPNGVQSMSMDIEGLVESSLNLGVCKLDEGGFYAKYSVRSSIESKKKLLNDKLTYITEFLGGDVTIDGDYPGWEYKADSPLRELAIAVYKEQYGKDPVIQAIHAGLECGLLSSKIHDLDCISLGPDIFGAHTTEERLSISSTKRVWEFLMELLKRCK